MKATLTHFLPRHFQHPPSLHSSPTPLHSSYTSTASDSSADSPATSSPFSPPIHKRHLSLPLPLPTSLLPSPPALARQSSKPSHVNPSQPPRALFVNTAITHPSPSSSPSTASSLPAVSAMHLSEGSQSLPCTPVGVDHPPVLPTWKVEVEMGEGAMDQSALSEGEREVVQPRSPVLPLRRVPTETPPPSPTAIPSTFPPTFSPSLSSTLAQTFSVEPSLPELLASISMVLHVQLIKDRTSSIAAQLRLPDFREETSQSSDDPTACPSVRSIYQFLLHVFQRGRFSSELALLSLVYVHRVMAGSGVSLTAINYRPLLMSALCLAQKMWDDTPLINSDFRILYPQLQSGGKSQFLSKFNHLEALMCEALHFNFLVTSDTYQLYLTELQAIWNEYEQGNIPGSAHPITGNGASALTPPTSTTPSPRPSPTLTAVTRSTGDEWSRSTPSPLREHNSRMSCHRHHPYAGGDRRLQRILKQQAMECGSDGEMQYAGDGEQSHHHLPGGWDPSVLTMGGA